MTADETSLFSSPADIALRVSRALAAGERLRQAKDETLIEALATAFRVFLDDSTLLGREARSLIPQSSRLSPEMVAWALEASVARVSPASLASLLATAPPRQGGAASPRSLHVVVLAHNVFTACVEPILCSLLARVPVVCKASSRDDVFARLLEMAWRDAAPDLADAFGTVTFPGGDRARESALFDGTDVLTVYGHDSTVEALTKRLQRGTSLVPRGTGLGCVFVGRRALGPDAALPTLEGVALDVAAYDQRGCLSPHTVFMEAGGALDAATFAEQLARSGLEPLRRTLPRGPLDMGEGARQMEWRAMGLARGHLVEGDGYAVSDEGTAPPRLSPGFRNVQVLTTGSFGAFVEAVLPFGRHLKAIGVAGMPPEDAARHLPPSLAPRCSAVGTMQQPPLDAFTDGGSRWEGLFRR